MKRSLIALLCVMSLVAMFALAACSSSGTASDDASSAAPAAAADDASAAPDAAVPASQSQDAEQGLYTIGDMCICDIYELDGQMVADLAYQIENVGDNPFDVHGTYLCLIDAEGNRIVEAEDATVLVAPEILNPGDIAFVYTTVPVPLPAGTDANGDYLPGGEVYLTALDGEIVYYEVSGASLSDQAGKPVVTGTVTNDTAVAAEPVQVAVGFLDANGELLGVTSVLIPSVAAGESYEFTTSTDGLPAACTTSNCADFDTIAVGYNA